MSPRIKKAIQWIAMLALAGVLLYFAFRGVKWEDFVNGIKNCRWEWIVLSMAASIAAFVVRGLRWRLVMLPLNPAISRREAYDGVTIAYLTNFALPRAGEFARCGVISATGKASFESVLGTVVLERTWDMLSYVIILVLILFAGDSAFMGFVNESVLSPLVDRFQMRLLWIVAAVIIAVLVCCWMLWHCRAVIKKTKVGGKLYAVLAGLLRGLKSGLKMKHKGLFFFYTFLLWFCYWLMSFCTIQAFPEVGFLNWADALFLMVVGGLGWIVPVQGGIGAYHFILSMAMASIYGIDQTQGVVFATISHESQALTMFICGAVSLFAIYITKRKSTKN